MDFDKDVALIQFTGNGEIVDVHEGLARGAARDDLPGLLNGRDVHENGEIGSRMQRTVCSTMAKEGEAQGMDLIWRKEERRTTERG